MPEGTAGIAVEIYLYTAYYYGKIRIKNERSDYNDSKQTYFELEK